MIDLTQWRNRLLINKDDLDTELSRQPQWLFEVSAEYTTALSIRDEAKETLARIDAELSLDIRRGCGDKKPTEGAVDAEIQTHARHVKAYDRYLRKAQDCAMWQALKDAFMQRGYALGTLADLYAQNYFGERASYGSSEAANARSVAVQRERIHRVRQEKSKHERE